MKKTLILLTGLCIAAGPATAPTSMPTSAPAGVVSAALVDPESAVPQLLPQIVAALEGGQDETAMKLCTQAVAGYGRTIPAKIDNENRINIYHCAAVAALRTKDTAKAKQYIDFVGRGDKSNRSVIFNRATIKTVNRGLVLQALDELDKYLAKNPTDEEMLNLFGQSLDVASKDTTNRQRVAPLVDHYIRYNSMLEKTRKGMRHWGTDWMTDKEFIKIDNDRQRSIERRDYAQRQVDQDIESVRAAQRALNDAQNDSAMGRGNSTWAQRGLDDANERLTKDRATLADAEAKVVRPVWTAPLRGMTPVLKLEPK